MGGGGGGESWKPVRVCTCECECGCGSGYDCEGEPLSKFERAQRLSGKKVVTDDRCRVCESRGVVVCERVWVWLCAREYECVSVCERVWV